MCHVGRQPTYITFIAFYLYLEYVGWFFTCITILATELGTWHCLLDTCGSATVHVSELHNVNMEVISQFFSYHLWPIFLIVLGDVSYTNMQGCVLDVAKALAFWGAFYVWQRVVSWIAKNKCHFQLGSNSGLKFGKYVERVWSYKHVCDASGCLSIWFREGY